MLLRQICKRIVIYLVFIITISSVNYVYAQSDVSRTMQALQGMWYDKNDEAFFNIYGDTINGYKVVDISNFAGGGNHFVADFKLFIKDHYGILRMEINKMGKVHYITVNNQITLKNVKGNYYKTNHFESIGGIYLGMTETEVLKFYGQPDRKDNDSWYYDKENWRIRFENGVVAFIYIYQGSPKKLDRSGLNIANSIDEYRDKYGVKISNLSDGLYLMKIAEGEYIWINKNDSNNYLMLSKYNY